MKKKLFCLFLAFCICFTLPLTAQAIEIIGSIDADDNATLIAPTLTVSSTPENAMGVAYNFLTRNTYYYNLSADVTNLNPNATLFREPGYIPESVLNNGDVTSPNAIFGEDDRLPADSTEQYPHRAIALLIAEYFANSEHDYIAYSGTATMIGSDVALTAAHCVYDENLGWPDQLTIYPGMYGSVTFPNLPYGVNSIGEVTEAVIGVPYYENPNNKHHDWAIVRVADPIGNYSGFLGFEYNPNNLEITDWDPWYIISGYPDDLNSTGSGDDLIRTHHYQYFASGIIFSDYNGETMASNGIEYPCRGLKHRIDVTAGQSGAAVLRLEPAATGAFVIVGIHYGSTEMETTPLYNEAVGINSQLYSFFTAYKNS